MSGEHSLGMCLDVVFTQQATVLTKFIGYCGLLATVGGHEMGPEPLILLVRTLALTLLCLWHLKTQLGGGKWLCPQSGLHPTGGGQ